MHRHCRLFRTIKDMAEHKEEMKGKGVRPAVDPASHGKLDLTVKQMRVETAHQALERTCRELVESLILEIRPAALALSYPVETFSS